MTELISISRNSPDFEKYLLGTHSTDTRAIPVQSLNVNSAEESVTYRIVPRRDVLRPFFFFLYLVKPRLMLLVLVPLFWVFTKASTSGIKISAELSLLNTLCLVCAAIALGIRNDFIDHIRGVDRVFPKNENRPLLNGWITPWKLNLLSQILLGLAFCGSLVVALVFPKTILYLMSGLVLGLLIQFRSKKSFKDKTMGEVFIYFLVGPLLAQGYLTSISNSEFNLEYTLFGFFWGLVGLWLIHLQNFESILVSSQMGFQNTMNRLGFDKGKMFLGFWWILIVTSHFFYSLRYDGMSWALFNLGVLIIFSASFFKRLYQLKSSIGSSLKYLCSNGYSILLALEVLLIIRIAGYLIAK